MLLIVGWRHLQDMSRRRCRYKAPARILVLLGELPCVRPLIIPSFISRSRCLRPDDVKADFMNRELQVKVSHKQNIESTEPGSPRPMASFILLNSSWTTPSSEVMGYRMRIPLRCLEINMNFLSFNGIEERAT